MIFSFIHKNFIVESIYRTFVHINDGNFPLEDIGKQLCDLESFRIEAGLFDKRRSVYLLCRLESYTVALVEHTKEIA